MHRNFKTALTLAISVLVSLMLIWQCVQSEVTDGSAPDILNSLFRFNGLFQMLERLLF